MPIEFQTREHRDELSRRLCQLAIDMMRCRDQGSHGQIMPTDENIDDVRTAAAIVSASNFHSTRQL